MSFKGEAFYNLWRKQVLANGGPEPGSWVDLYEYERKAWSKIAEPEMDRGAAINMAAELSAKLKFIVDGLEVLKKKAKSTPPKTLKKEWEKVEEAKLLIPKIEELIERTKEELSVVKLAAGWP